MRRAIAVLLGLVFGVLPASAMAQTVGGSVTSFGASEWISLVLRLGLVIGVIWAAVYAMRWYSRRAGGERGGAARTMDIVETRSLGPNRALHLVRIGGRAVLIGVTPERINALLEIDDPEVLDGLGPAAGGTSRPTFGALLAGLGAGGSAAKAAQTAAPNGMPPTRSRFGFRRGPRKPAASIAPRRPRRPLMDRALGIFGFTPVDPLPQAIERMRAVGPAPLTVPALPVISSTPATPTPGGVPALLPSAAAIAPSATQALRALSGYRAAQQTSHAGMAEAVDRDGRIAEAQRAVTAAPGMRASA